MSMRTLPWLAGLLLLCPAVLLAQGKEEETRTARAKQLAEALQKKDFDAIQKHFADKLTKVLGKDGLGDISKKLNEQLGELKKIGGTRPDKLGGLNVVYITCEFAKMKLDLRVVFDKDDRISGFQLVPTKGTFAFKPPAYAKPESFREVELVVGAGGDWPLPATLTLPKGDGPFPIVILVHGSGPHDRDETLGPNKPFRDIAWGLASQGIAVLRYVKRTQEHGTKVVEGLDKLTVKEEVIDDAVAAAALARKQKGIDPARVFILGHSLGAYAAPRIAKADAKLAGIIVLAGNTRPLEDLVIDQYTYLYGLEGKISEENQKKLDALKKQVARVKAAELPADTPRSDLPLNLPAAYWRDLKACDIAATAAALKQRILILQGERDYQVTMEDFAGWKKALKGHKGATLKSYPALNHLFMEGKGKGVPAEYGKEGHVAREVIDDIAAWVKK
jgi:hypothetical protein